MLTLVGIDLAKSSFQVHGNDARGKCLFRKKLSRQKLLEEAAQWEKCTIVVEACSGAHYFSRKFRELGHEAKIIPAQLVRPFVIGNKNDASDARAIAEAASRPNIRFVPLKTDWHLDLQAMHRIRSRLIKNRTALCNEIRSFLSEKGIVFAKSRLKLQAQLKILLQTPFDHELSGGSQVFLMDLSTELNDLNTRITSYDRQLEKISEDNATCQKLLKIKGVGVVTSTAIVAAIPDPHAFKNGRHFSACLGMVPRHSGTGGVNKNFGISKRGDKYLRSLLIHGGRSVLRTSPGKQDRLSVWATALKERRGQNKAAVAVANKLARVVWAVMTHEKDFDENMICRAA